MRPFVYLVPLALVVAFGYLVGRVWRSWKAAGARWGDAALRSGQPPPADLGEEVRQARELSADREQPPD